MIAVGLSWKMAIGACVLGNFIMGCVITINGRMGATVSHEIREAELSLHDSASHSIPSPCAYAFRLLLLPIRCVVPLRSRYRLARVSVS